MKYYIVRDWTWVEIGPNGQTQNGTPALDFVSENEIWKIINDAKENNKKIVVCEVGDCLIDWS